MDDNIVYEIAQMMSDKKEVKKDLESAKNIIFDMFQEKYLSKLNQVIKKHELKAQNTPSKEVELLKAYKSFMPEQSHKKLEEIIELLTMINTFKNIQSEVNISKNKFKHASNDLSYTHTQMRDSSEHEDGIYDIDMECKLNKNNSFMFSELMLAFALMSMK